MAELSVSSEILETLADGVVLSDANGRIVYVNGSAAQLSGYSPEELIGHRVETLIPSRLRPAHEGHRERYLESPVRRPMGANLDIVLRHRSGAEVPVDIALSSLASGNGRQVVAVIRDATAARQAQRYLVEQAHLLELANDGILVRRASDSMITYWNHGAVELYGFSRRQAHGRISHELLKTVVPEGLSALEHELGERGQWEGELVHTRVDGSTVVVSSRQVLLQGDRGDLGSIFEINRDVTEERRARKRLEAVTEVAQAILAGDGADRVLQLITHLARELAGAALATLALPEPDGGWLTVHVAEGTNADRLLGMRLPVRRSVSGRTLTSRQAEVIVDLSSDPDVFPDFAVAAEMGPAVFVPMLGQEENLGTLMLANPRGARQFADTARGVLVLFATAAAVAMEYSRARDRVERMMLLEERERIARELHDGAIQALFGLGMRLQHTALMTREPTTGGRLEEDVATLDGVIRDLRGYVFGLRPGILREAGLDQVLHQVVRQFEGESGVSTALELDPAAIRSLADRSAEVLQVVAEALSNVRKHAQSLTCSVSLHQEDGRVILRVQDDGRGFDHTASSSGHGLRNFRERAARLGGELTISRPDHGGTAIVLTIPA